MNQNYFDQTFLNISHECPAMSFMSVFELYDNKLSLNQ